MAARPRTRTSNNPARGFTLIEILAVVVLLAILGAMIIPKALEASDFQVIAAARSVASDIQYAQNAAISTGGNVTVSFDPNGLTYSLLDSNSALLIQPMSNAGYKVIFNTQSGMGQVSIQSAAFGTSNLRTVTFDATGSPDNSGTVTLQAGAYRYQITVAASTGKVSVAQL